MDPKEIESVKSQIDDLNAILSETVGAATTQSRRHERLGVLFIRLQDGDLPQRSLKRLEKQLLTDQDALNYHIEFMSLTALLHLHFHPDRAVHALPFAHCS